MESFRRHNYKIFGSKGIVSWKGTHTVFFLKSTSHYLTSFSLFHNHIHTRARSHSHSDTHTVTEKHKHLPLPPSLPLISSSLSHSVIPVLTLVPFVARRHKATQVSRSALKQRNVVVYFGGQGMTYCYWPACDVCMCVTHLWEIHQRVGLITKFPLLHFHTAQSANRYTHIKYTRKKKVQTYSIHSSQSRELIPLGPDNSTMARSPCQVQCHFYLQSVSGSKSQTGKAHSVPLKHILWGWKDKKIKQKENYSIFL